MKQYSVFFARHARKQAEEIILLHVLLHWFLGGSTHWLSTGNAAEPLLVYKKQPYLNMIPISSGME